MSDLLQLPIINSPPAPQPARLASTPEPEGSAFKDVLQNQLDVTKTTSAGKTSETSDKPAAEEAVSQPTEPTNQESETNNQPKIDPNQMVFDPALLGIPVAIQPQNQVEQPLTDSSVPDGIIETVQNTDAAIQTITANVSIQAKVAASSPNNKTMETTTSRDGEPVVPQTTLTEGLKPELPVQTVAGEEKSSEPDQSNRLEMAVPVKTEASARDSAKTNPNIQAAQPDAGSHGKADSVAVEQVTISQPVSTKTLEKSTFQEPLKGTEPVQVQAPPGESPGQVEIRPTGLETSPTKTMEPARLAEAQTTNILGQITRQMDGLIQSGRNSIRIQLNPQDLGQIDLKITSTHQGVGVTMIAENSATGKLLENQMNQLRQTLSDAGIQIANLHIGTQSNPQSFHGSSQPQNFKNSAYPGRETSIPQVENERIIRHESSLIDYKI